ncbi:MAG: esterase/lipase family protein [bacterium]
MKIIIKLRTFYLCLVIFISITFSFISPAYGTKKQLPLPRTALNLRLECSSAPNHCRVVDTSSQKIMFSASLAKCEKFMINELQKRHGSGYPNLPLWTFGGRQIWADVYFYSGWRIQYNIYTNHYRLLDPDSQRHAWGSYEACRTVFEKIRIKKNIIPRSSHIVVVVHGLFRSRFHMSKITRALAAAGYEPVNIDYPSTLRPITEHSRQLAKLIERYEGADTVSFVTHSMGGLVVRGLFAEENWQKDINLHRLVMIAPPNQGSEIARLLQDVPLYNQVTGPPGEQLIKEAQNLPVPEIEFGIIAGLQENPIGFSPLIQEKNDGLIAVENTHLAGSSAFKIISGDHNNLPYKQKTIDSVLNFLKNGKFEVNGKVKMESEN